MAAATDEKPDCRDCRTFPPDLSMLCRICPSPGAHRGDASRVARARGIFAKRPETVYPCSVSFHAGSRGKELGMSGFSFVHDAARLSMFSMTSAIDPNELDCRSQMSDRLPGQSRAYRYMLQDPAIWRMRFKNPIVSVAIRSTGSILVSYGETRFATEVALDGEESDFFGFSAPLRGRMTLIRRGEPNVATSARGLIYRLGPDTKLVTGDDSLRSNVFIKVAEVEHMLEGILDQRLRRPLVFEPCLDWSSGLAASLKLQLDFVLQDFERADGIASNPVALASITDLLVTLILRGVRHNHADEIGLGLGSVVPKYVSRAEEFMRANCGTALRVADIAAAAGCSVRTLNTAFQRFRNRVPLASLQAIRLQQVHIELSRGNDGIAIGAVAKRYGFTNAARFNLAFRRRFGQTPTEVVRRGSRW